MAAAHILHEKIMCVKSDVALFLGTSSLWLQLERRKKEQVLEEEEEREKWGKEGVGRRVGMPISCGRRERKGASLPPPRVVRSCQQLNATLSDKKDLRLCLVSYPQKFDAKLCNQASLFPDSNTKSSPKIMMPRCHLATLPPLPPAGIYRSQGYLQKGGRSVESHIRFWVEEEENHAKKVGWVGGGR